MSDASLLTGLPPIAAPDARVLILGSFPSVASLAAGQYYAHKQNAFWPIMGALFGAGRELDYSDRTLKLQTSGVAIWDVLCRCKRSGSLDADIDRSSERPNNFGEFFDSHPDLRVIAFNGRKAAECFRRHVNALLPSLCVGHTLPSTSPANASWPFERKLEVWRMTIGEC